jgi:hypothetical protein
MIVSFHNMFFFVLTENGKIFSSRTRIIKKMESYNIFKKKVFESKNANDFTGH